MPTSEYLNTLTINSNGPFKIKNPLPVNFTQSNNTITCDKTVAEIIAALEAGRQAITFVSAANIGYVMAEAKIYTQDSSSMSVTFIFNLGIYYISIEGSSELENGSWTNDTWTIENKTAGLNDINGVTLTSPASGQVLTYNGSSWVNGTPSAAGRDITHMRDIEATSSGSVSLTFENAANSAFITLPSTLSINALSLEITCSNRSENYIWIENKTNADVNVLLSSLNHGTGTIYIGYYPDGGFKVPTGKTCEIGFIINQNGSGYYRIIVTSVNYLVGNVQ